MLESWECVSRVASLVPTSAKSFDSAAKKDDEQQQQSTSSGSTVSGPAAVASAAKGRPLFSKEARSLANRAQQAARAGSLPALTKRYSVLWRKCFGSRLHFALKV